MGDAGIFAWKEKYRHDLWRPMLGIREYDPSPGPGAGEGSELDERGDPFWPLLGSGCCGTSALTRSEEHTSELQSLMRISYAVFCLKKKTEQTTTTAYRLS